MARSSGWVTAARAFYRNRDEPHPAHDLLLSFRLDQRLETRERAIPALRYLIQVSAYLLESFGLQLPDRFAPDALTAHKPCIGERTQMLGDGLTRDISRFGQAHDRLRTGIPQAQDDAQARFIAERLTARCGIRDPSSYEGSGAPWRQVTPPRFLA